MTYNIEKEGITGSLDRIIEVKCTDGWKAFMLPATWHRGLRGGFNPSWVVPKMYGAVVPSGLQAAQQAYLAVIKKIYIPFL